MKKFLTLLALFAAAIQTQAAVLLTIDMTDISAVVITATGNFADINATSDAANFPVQLKGFFTVDPGTTTYSALETTLQGPSSGDILDSILGGRSGPSQTTAILRTGSGKVETFSTTSTAFTGYAIFDLSSIESFLPTWGDSGNITTDNAGSEIIGTWEVATVAVPEPSTYAALAGLATLGLVFWRRRKA
ncbi:MAG: PEP-CTERM sorting domain-containing protein [Verrucomicrobiota bacterium JB022]|nr:PEP-CTERM sorting domain-containing protein [Verrucomicrobiota bacterium JB022]